MLISADFSASSWNVGLSIISFQLLIFAINIDKVYILNSVLFNVITNCQRKHAFNWLHSFVCQSYSYTIHSSKYMENLCICF